MFKKRIFGNVWKYLEIFEGEEMFRGEEMFEEKEMFEGEEIFGGSTSKYPKSSLKYEKTLAEKQEAFS